MTFVFHGFGDLSVHLGRPGAFFLGILENAQPFEADAVDKIQQGREMFVVFAREAGDEGGADGETGNTFAHPDDEVLDMLP